MSDSPADIPAFADLAADPEIAPLLGFAPVVRKVRRPDGWTPELQRELIARLAATEEQRRWEPRARQAWEDQRAREVGETSDRHPRESGDPAF